MKKYFNNVTIILACTCCIVLSACKKFVTVDPPIDKITAATVFASDQSALSAVLGVYSNMMMTEANIFTGGTTIYTSLSSDELVYNSTVDEIRSFNTNTLSPTNSTISNQFWARAYGIIYQSNACIEGLAASTGVTPATKQQLSGEMKLVRAFTYFNLVNIFGDVPLVLTTEYRTNASLARASRNDVFAQVIKDLKEAQSSLSVTYPTTGRVRPVKAAATALLARAYLYTGQWSLAESEATAVITNTTYSLVSNLDNVFLATSTEAIWQLAPVTSGFNTIEGNRFVPGTTTARPQYSLTTQLQSAFEPLDKRKTSWVKTNISAGVPYTYPAKYKVRSSTTVTENLVLLRLGEQYLIRAEARAQQEKLTEAVSDINVIRTRAGLPNTTAISKTAILLAVEQERRIELFAEWGHRWYDIKRWNKADAILAPIKPGWQSYYALYPIPFSQLLKNPSLTQNPGY